MKYIRLAGMAVVLGAALTSCGEVALVAAMQFDLAVTPAQVRVRAGEQGRLDVRITRLVPDGLAPVAVDIALADPPAGVTAERVSVPPGRSDAALTLRIARDVTPAGPVLLTVRGRAGVFTKAATTTLTVLP